MTEDLFGPVDWDSSDYKPGSLPRMMELRVDEYDALLAERDALRQALEKARLLMIRYPIKETPIEVLHEMQAALVMRRP